MSAVARARWAVVVCLLALLCVAGRSWPAAADHPMPAMDHGRHAVGDQRQDAGPGGHCVDPSQQCHQATVDVVVASVAAADLASPDAPALRCPGLVPCVDASVDRPPDIHALCVNRI
ncbi:hypothetical protein ACFTSF_11170 [Kribbella sp. NPDC056951]|uniref:hypothetical protein n=1 Tax=Kribbella sp. NPDC056951 TaxID=3345978 RepID=UPI00362B2CD4